MSHSALRSEESGPRGGGATTTPPPLCGATPWSDAVTTSAAPPKNSSYRITDSPSAVARKSSSASSSNNNNNNNNSANRSSVVNRPTQLSASATLPPPPLLQNIQGVVELQLNSKFLLLRNRVVFFRPLVWRMTSGDRWTQRVVFITASGKLYLCDNLGVPKRSLHVSTEVNKIAVEGSNVIAFVMPEHALVLKFETRQELKNLPSVKTLINVLKYFCGKDKLSVLTGITGGIRALHLNVSKPEGYRPPARIAALTESGGATEASRVAIEDLLLDEDATLADFEAERSEQESKITAEQERSGGTRRDGGLYGDGYFDMDDDADAVAKAGNFFDDDDDDGDAATTTAAAASGDEEGGGNTAAGGGDGGAKPPASDGRPVAEVASSVGAVDREGIIHGVASSAANAAPKSSMATTSSGGPSRKRGVTFSQSQRTAVDPLDALLDPDGATARGAPSGHATGTPAAAAHGGPHASSPDDPFGAVVQGSSGDDDDDDEDRLSKRGKRSSGRNRRHHHGNSSDGSSDESIGGDDTTTEEERQRLASELRGEWGTIRESATHSLHAALGRVASVYAFEPGGGGGKSRSGETEVAGGARSNNNNNNNKGGTDGSDATAAASLSPSTSKNMTAKDRANAAVEALGRAGVFNDHHELDVLRRFIGHMAGVAEGDEDDDDDNNAIDGLAKSAMVDVSGAAASSAADLAASALKEGSSSSKKFDVNNLSGIDFKQWEERRIARKVCHAEDLLHALDTANDRLRAEIVELHDRIRQVQAVAINGLVRKQEAERLRLKRHKQLLRRRELARLTGGDVVAMQTLIAKARAERLGLGPPPQRQQRSSSSGEFASLPPAYATPSSVALQFSHSSLSAASTLLPTGSATMMNRQGSAGATAMTTTPQLSRESSSATAILADFDEEDHLDDDEFYREVNLSVLVLAACRRRQQMLSAATRMGLVASRPM